MLHFILFCSKRVPLSISLLLLYIGASGQESSWDLKPEQLDVKDRVKPALLTYVFFFLSFGTAFVPTMASWLFYSFFTPRPPSRTPTPSEPWPAEPSLA